MANSWGQRYRMWKRVRLFLAFRECKGFGERVGADLAALAYGFKRRGGPDPTKEVVVRDLVAVIRRVAAEERTSKMDTREPFPLVALKAWVSSSPASKARGTRDPALVAVGLRMMARPNELTALLWSQVVFLEDGGMKVFVDKAKNDQLRVGRWVYIDAVMGSVTCPVHLLQAHWMAVGEPKEGFVFSSCGGRRMSVSAVSAVVKNMAEAAQCKVRVSGDFLRRCPSNDPTHR